VRLLSKEKKDYGTNIPPHEIEALARCLLPEMRRFFESKQGQKEFIEWKARQALEKKNKG